MNLYIMTRGRLRKQLTLATIPWEMRQRVFLVVGASEEAEHYELYGKTGAAQILTVPHTVTNYSQKFQWLLDNNEGKFVIMDDDLSFAYREGAKLLHTTEPQKIMHMWSVVEDMLDDAPLVGIHPRQMGHTQPEPYVENGKIICIQAINKELFPDPKNMPRVDEFPILADVMLNCYLLSNGYHNAILTSYTQDHASCQAPGGCSIYRTTDMQRKAVERVAELYGPHAQAVIKRPKRAKWMGDERVDLRVQWKRMYAEGLARRMKNGI